MVLISGRLRWQLKYSTQQRDWASGMPDGMGWNYETKKLKPGWIDCEDEAIDFGGLH